MVRRQIELFTSIVLFFMLAGSARATIIWGVTCDKNMSDPYGRSEVFTVDTETWAITRLDKTTLDENNLGINYSDIAVTASGAVYTVGSDYKGGGDYFEDLFMLDPTTGQPIESWHGINPLNRPINGLTALDNNTLLAVEGGHSGIVYPHLIQINLDPVTGSFVGSVDLGRIDTKPYSSGGDIVKSIDGDVFLASLGGGQDFYQIDPANPGGATVDFTTDISKFAGLAYDYYAQGGPALVGGVYTNRKLYSIDTTTGQTGYELYLGNNLCWNTAGLDSIQNIPEPATIFLLGLGSLVFLRNRPS